MTTMMGGPRPESLLVKYETEVERLLALKGQLDVEERRVKWVPLAGIALGLAVAFGTKPLYGLLPFALSLVVLVTGFYLTRVHRMERDYNLVRARREVSRLRAEAKERAGSDE